MPTPHPHRPSFMSLKTLAHELDVSERTVLDMVKRGIIPQPCELSSGCVRWRWDDVEEEIASRKRNATVAEDPFLAGIRNAISSP